MRHFIGQLSLLHGWLPVLAQLFTAAVRLPVRLTPGRIHRSSRRRQSDRQACRSLRHRPRSETHWPWRVQNRAPGACQPT
ncbi:hypothetical protein DYE20_05180 [[Mycobacterium] chelonae subsp. gwanakae]|nr:hypothetical protein DYE20_05180 [[Mycobacterium] chelonae subsp. gwanakae]